MSLNQFIFLCQCGNIISDKVDFSALKAEFPNSTIFTHSLLCSPDGKKFFRDQLQQNKVNDNTRITIAACSPKMHEKTFQTEAEALSVNVGQIQMANIREQCAWVTNDKNKATEKATRLIKAALERSKHSVFLEKRNLDVHTDLLIIGGGITGIEAALTAAQAGRKVTIVEKAISLGGQVIKTEEVSPNLECAPCFLSPRLSAIRDNPLITVITNAEVKTVKGFKGNFQVSVLQKPFFVNENCIGCEACFETCPVEVSHEFHHHMLGKKAIHTLFPGSVPAYAAIDQQNCLHFKDESCNACISSCPFEAIDFQQSEKKYEIQVGAILIANGMDYNHYANLSNYGYGIHKRVFTLPMMERYLSSNGIGIEGLKEIIGTDLKKIAVIHCAGSLNGEGALKYCSNVCCTNSLKISHILRKSFKSADIVHLYKRLTFSNPQEENFYNREKERLHFEYCPNIHQLTIEENQQSLKIKGLENSLYQNTEFDMIVLATGIKPSNHNQELASLMHVELTKEGFFKSGHDLLYPNTTTMDGIYVAGCTLQPSNIPNSISQARSAIGDYLSTLIPGQQIELEMLTSHIDEKICAGCKVCISSCPYKAIVYDANKKVSYVQESICRGCGTCTATCPTGASTAKNFSDNQLLAELKSIINA